MSKASLIIAGLLISVLSAPPVAGDPGQGLPQKKDQLLVFGQGFTFGVKEPAGWQGDTERAAKYKVNVLFFPKGQGRKSLDGAIRVGIYKKSDENAAADLKVDMDNYLREYAGVRFEDFNASHAFYAVFSKVFVVEGRFHEYVVYLNPGRGFWYLFSVALNTGKRPANESELSALREVVSSLSAMGGGKRDASILESPYPAD